MFRSRGQHEVRRSCWNRGREKIKLDVERFIDLTSKSHRSSTNSVINGMNSMGRGFILKFQIWMIFRVRPGSFILVYHWNGQENGRYIKKVDVAEVDHTTRWFLWENLNPYMTAHFELGPTNSFYLSFKALIFITNNFTLTCIQIGRCMYTLNDVESYNMIAHVYSLADPYHRLFEMRLS